jgi:hypothetical protein
MDQQPPVVTVRFNKFLPYWAVFQTDLRQTLRSWVYRLWVLMTVLAATGFLLYRVGVQREAGIWQSAANQGSDLFRLVVVGSLALIVVLAVSGIGSERGTVADSVLSRGISRRQYYLAKWHARLVVVVVTFAVLGGAVLAASHFLFDSGAKADVAPAGGTAADAKTDVVRAGGTAVDAKADLSFVGGLAAVVAAAAVLAVIVSWGVAIGALTNSTVLGITVFWLVLYGAGFLLSLLPEPYPSPDRELGRLRFVLRGQFNGAVLFNFVLAAAGLSVLAAAVGLHGFSRRDV